MHTLRSSLPRLVFLICALLAVALTLAVVVSGGAPLPGDMAAAKAVQRLDSPFADALFRGVNTAGDWWHWPIFIAGGLLTLAAARRNERRDRVLRLGASFVATLALRSLGPLLKAIVESPRPSPEDGLRVARHFSGYGFPSGHVFGDLLFYGWLALFAAPCLPHRLIVPAQTLAWAVIALSGPARIYAGAHWPSDALGGYLWGATCLALAATIARRGTPG